MPSVIEHETMNVDDLPGVWNPVQWDLSEAERAQEIENQARASLLWSVDVPEAILRLLLNETQIERAYEPPDGFDPEMQGEWDHDLITFKFLRDIKLEGIEREGHRLVVTYELEGLGYWCFQIEPEKVVLERV